MLDTNVIISALMSATGASFQLIRLVRVGLLRPAVTAPLVFEYDDVAGAISMVMAGIDPETKQFTAPPDSIKKDIAEVEADKSMSAADKKQMLTELNEALKTAAPLQHPENVPLVLKYYDKIDEVLQ